MHLNLIDVLNSADSEMGFVSKITEGWTCEGQLTVLLLEFGTVILLSISSLPLLALAPVSSHSGPALRIKLAGN